MKAGNQLSVFQWDAAACLLEQCFKACGATSMHCIGLCSRWDCCTQEASDAEKDPLTQHADLVQERDNLHPGMEILSEQFNSHASRADLQEGKLGAEIQQLSEQLSEQQLKAQQAAKELQDLQKQHASVTQERDSLRLSLRMLTEQPGSEAQSEAAAARRIMEDHVVRLRERFYSELTFELPQAAQQLLYNHSLAVDIAQAHAQCSVYRDILETIQAHGSWRDVMQHAWKQRQQVHELVKAPISWQLEDHLADISKMTHPGRHFPELFTEGKEIEGKLQVALMELETMREAFNAAYREVGSWRSSQLHRNDRMAAATLEMKQMFARAPSMIASRVQACASAATRQQTAICNQLTAYCSPRLSRKERSRLSSTPLATVSQIVGLNFA